VIDPQLVIELLVRTLATAAVVILVVQIAAKAGPAVGGVVAGLPIVLGPGYFFLLREQPPAFVADAATGSLLSLSATQIFLFVYIVAAARFAPFATLALAALAWSLAAAFLGLFDPGLVFGSLSFMLVTLAARTIGRSFVKPVLPSKAGRARGLLLLRGIAAGLLVGLVSLGSSTFGTVFSGALMAFPIGFSAIGLSLHRDLGAAMAVRAAHAGLYGLTSLAVFCVTLALSLAPLGATLAFFLSLAMSGVTTMIGLALTRRFGSMATRG
jgi:hypothetical protein